MPTYSFCLVPAGAISAKLEEVSGAPITTGIRPHLMQSGISVNVGIKLELIEVEIKPLFSMNYNYFLISLILDKHGSEH